MISQNMDTSTVTCTKDKTRQHHKKECKIDDNFDMNRNNSTTNSIHEPITILDDYDSTDSLETASDEIPVWIYGEKRWISGVNEETTCTDLINVLLADEGLSLGNNISPSANTTNNKGFVITERWRRVEQILHDDTKILQIWSAWGHAKSEVKLTLRQFEPMPDQSHWSNEQDSGMGSPNGSTNSAITRRRRHRASKSTIAWVTQAQTIHPKSQKATIEKLMKLILEQGETIQQQLAKLRDRELQIAKIEEDRHRVREREHGKNYLLETYLNGLHESEEKEIVTANSDSGVQTEGATSSPEISSCIQEDEDYPTTSSSNFKYKEKLSHREKKLLKEHKNTKEFSSFLTESNLEQTKELENDISAKIEWMEKLVVINKHLQREEELMVRLGAKIRKYESENPTLNEKQIRDALIRVNANIETNNGEMKQIEDDLFLSNQTLEEKTTILDVLNKELVDVENDSFVGSSEELVENLYSFSKYISKSNYDFNEINENREQKHVIHQNLPNQLNFQQNSNEILISERCFPIFHSQQQQQQQSFQQHYDHLQIPPPAQFNDDSIPYETSLINRKITQTPIVKCKILNPPQSTLSTPSPDLVVSPSPLLLLSSSSSSTTSSSPIVSALSSVTCNPCNQTDIRMSMNLLQKPDQKTIFNTNVYTMNTSMGSKLGPKKLISTTNGICNEFESNSDTGLSSLGEDVIHMGTLV